MVGQDILWISTRRNLLGKQYSCPSWCPRNRISNSYVHPGLKHLTWWGRITMEGSYAILPCQMTSTDAQIFNSQPCTIDYVFICCSVNALKRCTSALGSCYGCHPSGMCCNVHLHQQGGREVVEETQTYGPLKDIWAWGWLDYFLPTMPKLDLLPTLLS